MELEMKGLENRGANNCFLNVVIQTLWHTESFRESFGNSLNYHKCPENKACIICSLYVCTVLHLGLRAFLFVPSQFPLHFLGLS